MESVPALTLDRVWFKYPTMERPALDDVSMEIRRGEFVSILGANGSGKSTLCLLANGLIPHTVRGELRGAVHVFGEEVSKKSVSELSSRVGMVFQEPESQLFCMSVEEEVAFGPENLGVPIPQIQERVDWALELVGMGGYQDRSPFSLSGGQKQRVAIAAALSMRPDMLVLDEPAYALDPVGRVELYKVLRELKERHGVTVLLAERDAEEASLYSDKVVLLESGKVMATGSPAEVLKDPAFLSTLGISPPQMSQVSASLRERMHGSSFNFLTVDDAERSIVDAFSRKRGSGPV
jgi:energy-coupling factor transport system ATP-binding protein